MAIGSPPIEKCYTCSTFAVILNQAPGWLDRPANRSLLLHARPPPKEMCLQLLLRSIRLLRCGLRHCICPPGRFLPSLKAASGRPASWAMAVPGSPNAGAGARVAFPSGFCPPPHKLVSFVPVGATPFAMVRFGAPFMPFVSPLTRPVGVPYPRGCWLTALADEARCSRSLQTQYVGAGWLEQPTRGVYRRPRGTVSWQQAVISLQTIIGARPLVVGGRTALELQGFAHYLSQSLREVHLYGSKAPPGWLSKLPLNVRFVFHNSRTLFASDAPDRMAVDHAWNFAKGAAVKGLNLGDGFVAQPWGQWEWPLTMSRGTSYPGTPQRAAQPRKLSSGRQALRRAHQSQPTPSHDISHRLP